MGLLQNLPTHPISRQQIKYIRELGHKKCRYIYGEFVLEGEKSVTQLLHANYKVTLLVATPSFITKNRRLLQTKSIQIRQANKTLLPTLGNFKSNNSVLAVAKIPPSKLPNFTTSYNNIVLALDTIQDPGNLGTIIRIADWYGIQHVICSNSTVDLYNPKVLQASMGSFLHMNIVYTSLKDYLPHLQLPILGTCTRGVSIHKTKLPAVGVLIIGNESHGMSDNLFPYIQQTISIPSYGQAESLNAAIATAVICDSWRQQNPLK